MRVIGGYIAAGLIYALIISIIGGWIFIWYYKIKCRKIRKCKKNKCIYRQFCDRTAMSDTEKEELKNYFEKRLQENKQCPKEDN